MHHPSRRLHLSLRRKHKKYSPSSVRCCLTKRFLHRRSGVATGGLVAGAIVGVLLILFGVFMYYRRKRRQATSSDNDRVFEIPKSKHSYGTGPVAHHTPSLPLPPSRPSPPDPPIVSVSQVPPDEDGSTNRSFTSLNADSTTSLVPRGGDAGGDWRSSHGSRASRPSEFGQGGGGSQPASWYLSPPSYPPSVALDNSSRRSSGQVEWNSLFPRH